MGDASDQLVTTSQRTIRVLDALRKQNEAGVTELATTLDINKSTVHNHLKTLEREGLVVRDGSRYRLGLRLLEFGGYIQYHHRLYEVATPELETLASKSGELATLTVEEHGRSVCLACQKGERAVDLDVYPGVRRPIHLTAHGKAILAQLSSDRIDQILSRHGLTAATEQSITDRAELESRLDTIEERGYAIDEGEYIEGLRCVAAPISYDDGEQYGAIGVSAPVQRSDPDRLRDELPELIQSSANVIQLNLDRR